MWSKCQLHHWSKLFPYILQAHEIVYCDRRLSRFRWKSAYLPARSCSLQKIFSNASQIRDNNKLWLFDIRTEVRRYILGILQRMESCNSYRAFLTWIVRKSDEETTASFLGGFDTLSQMFLTDFHEPVIHFPIKIRLEYMKRTLNYGIVRLFASVFRVSAENGCRKKLTNTLRKWLAVRTIGTFETKEYCEKNKAW